MRFRWHRGSLVDSMLTVTEFNGTMEGLFGVVEPAKEWAGDFGPSDISVKPYGHDARIDWDTYLVLVNGHVLGMCDGLPEPPVSANMPE